MNKKYCKKCKQTKLISEFGLNEKLKNLIKLEKKKVASVINTTAGVTWNSYYVSSSPIVESKDDDEPSFNVLVNPINLEKSEKLKSEAQPTTTPLTTMNTIIMHELAQHAA